MGGVGRVACQGFLVREVCVIVLVGGAGFLLSGVQLSVVKNLLPMQEILETGSSLGWEDPLEGEMITYSTILAWTIPWTERPGRL